MLFDVCDLDLYPIALVLKLDLDMAVTFLHINKEAKGLMAQLSAVQYAIGMKST